MGTHQMKLQPGPFERIRQGSQTIESRLNDEKRQLVKPGDTIEFSKLPDLQEKLSVKVKELLRFPTFLELFTDIEASKFGAEGYSVDQLVESMRKYYTEEEETKYGVVGIVIEPE